MKEIIRMITSGLRLKRLIKSFARPMTYDLRPTTYVLFLLLVSCRPSPQYQDHYNIPGGAWNAAYQPQFHFTITDTAAAYQLFLLIRHTDVYPFSNIWIAMDSKAPGDSTWGKTRVEVPLAAPTGQWLGRGAGELWEQRVPITSPTRPAFFAKKGTYTVRLTHEMRRNPLPEVLTIGFRLEKLPPFRKEQ
jgi:gliding motility-associated lipoprotein GldH